MDGKLEKKLAPKPSLQCSTSYLLEPSDYFNVYFVITVLC